MGQKGQSLVELAVSFTLLMLLLAGAVDFGIAFFQFVQLRDSAQEGALFGSYCQDDTLIRERIIGSSNSPVNLASPDVTISIHYLDKDDGQIKDVSLIEEGDGLRVRVSYAHKVFMPFLSAIIGDFLNLHGEVIDTILKVDC